MIFDYVSDQNYVALSGVAAECVSVVSREVTVVVSRPSGALDAPLSPGPCRVIIALQGYGSKRIECVVEEDHPLQFRLLTDTPYGFMWPKWSRSGEHSEIRAHATEQCQLSLWRYGLRKESIGVFSWFDEHGPFAVKQILPDADFSQSGVHWNHVGYPCAHPQQSVAAPSRSGLYFLWGETLSRRCFSFPWIVAPENPAAKIAVLANTNTWNAYNAFGGRSNYINPAGLPATPTVNARQGLDRYTSAESVWMAKDEAFTPLSFERPEPGNDIVDNTAWDERGPADSIRGRIQSSQAPGEWRSLAWLEREGLDSDYYADAQLHDGTLDLSAYTVLVLGVHPEYWSRTMFERAEQWVQSDGRLMYLGGNGLNCEVIFADEATLQCLLHEDLAENEHPGNESRTHRTYQPESSLLGVAFTNPGAMTSAPYAVLDASHWILAGTGLKNGDLFGASFLHERGPGGASCDETDKIMPNSPAGLMYLAQGTNARGGGADMVTFPLGSGEIFSTGSITWVSSLFPAERISRITRNVLQNFLGRSEH